VFVNIYFFNLSPEPGLNTIEYQKGIKVSDYQMKQINLVRHDELPLWNYSLVPKGSNQNAN
jgi:hypothetical protein